jgi:hypothetical protein
MSTPAVDDVWADESVEDVSEPPELQQDERPPQPQKRRGPGRPKGSLGMGRKVVQTRQEFITDSQGNVIAADPDATEAVELPPIFDPKSITDYHITKIRVSRTTPDEGFLGYLDDVENATEASIKDIWGGGTYRLDGTNSTGKLLKVTTRKISGDPKFESLAAEITWKRQKGIPLTPAVTGEKAMSTADVLIMLKQIEAEKHKEMEEREEKNRKAREDAEKQRRQEERDHQERMRRLDIEAAERARKDDDERDRRRKLDDEERENRRRREVAETETRQQNFMQQTIQMVQQSGQQALQFVKATAAEKGESGGHGSIMDTIKMVLAIKEAFGGGGDPEETTDPMALVLKHGPEWLNGLGNAIGGTIREIKGGGVRPAPAQIAAQPGNPLAGLPIPADNPLSGKLTTLVSKLAAKGINPEVALNSIVDRVLTDVDGLPAQGATVAKPSTPNGPVPFTHDPRTVANATPIQSATPAGVPAATVVRKVVRIPFRAN